MSRTDRAKFRSLSLLNWPVVAGLGVFSRRFIKRRAGQHTFVGIVGDFRDNAAYFYLNAADALGDCVWLANSRAESERLADAGVVAIPRRSLAGIKRLLTSSTVIVCDNTYWVSWFGQGARVINLWHGIPTKRIGYDLHGELSYRFPAPDRRDPIARAVRSGRPAPTQLVTVSPMLTPHFMSAFSVGADQCLEIGYPRCDHLLSPNADSDAAAMLRVFHNVAIAESDACTIGYFPTWRDSRSTERVAETLQALLDADLGFDFEVVFKPHHLMGEIEPHPNGPPAGTTGALHWLAADCDLNSVLGRVDIMVSDYSSACWDFLLCDRPAVFVEIDRAEYSDERGFYGDVSDLIYGEVVTDLSDLSAALRAAHDHPERDADRRALARAVLWEGYTGDAAERLIEVVSDGRR